MEDRVSEARRAKKTKMKPSRMQKLPLVMTILAALYLVYVAASQDTAMNADAVGGDPGGKFLPFIMGSFLFAGFLWETIKERAEESTLEPESRRLFFLTLALSILYIASMRLLGFMIASTLLLYILIYEYTTIGEPRDRTQAAVGGAGTVLATTVLYFLFRFATRQLLYLGRSGALPLFKSAATVAVVALVIVTGVTVLLSQTVHKMLCAKGLKRISTSAIVTLGTVSILYVVFRQFFFVALPQGLLVY